jgi:hypothetical protein
MAHGDLKGVEVLSDFGKIPRLTVKSISESGLGDQVDWVSRVRFDLQSQIHDVVVDNTVDGVAIIPHEA